MFARLRLSKITSIHESNFFLRHIQEKIFINDELIILRL